MFAEFIILFVVFLATVIIYIVTQARKNYGALEKLGIPVVKPHFFLGSSPDFYKIENHLQDLERFKKYGEVFGSYEGDAPTVFICDPDIVRQVMIKDFDHFRNHNMHDFLGFANKELLYQMMEFLSDEKWKVVRSLMSPTFTSAKIKRMSLIMKNVSEEYVEQIKADLKQSSNGVLANVNLFDEILAVLTDMVARITLNIKIDNPKDPNNDFTKAIRQMFAMVLPTYIVPFTRIFPILREYFRSSTSNTEIDFFSTVFKKVMAERKKSRSAQPQQQGDFIDFLNEFRDKTETDSALKRLGITESTVIANAVIFYIAGQDSMSTAISALAYYLTRNPDIEKKLHAEIDAYTKKYSGRVEHDTLGDLPYLNACLSEALRLHPVFIRPERECNQDWEYKGLKIKKGMTVVVPLWAYHRNPKNFPDPEKFDPERFMPYNKDKLNPAAYGSFGFGPRLCMGMKFSQECLAILSVHIFKNFQFKARPDTEITYIPGITFAAMMGPMNLDVVQRSASS